MTQSEVIINLTKYLIDESKKNYMSYTIKKNSENTRLDYENKNQTKIRIVTTKRNVYIMANGETMVRPFTDEGMIIVKRFITNNIN